MEIVIFIISGSILFIAFKLLTSMPSIPPRNNSKIDYDDFYISAATKINAVKSEAQLNDADITRLKFGLTFKNHTRVNEDNETLKLQIEGKKRLYGVGLWLCLIISFNVNAQYVGVQLLNKGMGVNAGILANNVNIQAALTFPITNLENANTYSLSAGYQLNLSNDEADNYSITPSIGAALLKTRTWNEKAAMAMTTHNNIKPIYGVELAKDAFMGRVFINASYSDALYYGIGMKVFFNR